PNQDNRQKAARAFAAMVFKATCTWPKIKGIENLPKQPNIIVANHASYLDGILLTAILPNYYQFVIKREITEIPLIHFFLKRLGSHFVDRYNHQRGASDTRKLLRFSSEGVCLVFFT
ncbi:MAG: lysophospholipid acyltransferase family protein, partial [Pseudomonadota bacterium]|nr:lysophospholipid acyltransferase family protein [Pseudomonadota bacterium]